jgi:prolyl-tRNA editing enzyme YbaK/EbsC (Cys-tRNA(Pro) deacylase)
MLVVVNPPATVFDRLTALLDAAHVPYAVTRHAPVRTSEEAAQVRGTALSSGAKALVCKAGERFVLLVLPADRRLDSAAARRQLGAKSLRFASADEVAALTGLPPGAIPPFGQLFGLPTCCDARLADEATINFNAGDRGISVAMAAADYLAVERPVLGRIAHD